jgi:hypothetical protein
MKIITKKRCLKCNSVIEIDKICATDPKKTEIGNVVGVVLLRKCLALQEGYQLAQTYYLR